MNMTPSPHVWNQANLFLIRLLPAALVCAVVLVSGCAEKRLRALPWATAIQSKPLPFNVNATESEAPVPDLDAQPPVTTVVLPSKPGPARPRQAQVTLPENDSAGKGSAPILAPELSAQDIATAQQQIHESSAVAQKNLDAVRGKALNPAQTELASKVTNFLNEARDAAKQNDWTRARNLAKKAQVLSEELAGTL